MTSYDVTRVRKGLTQPQQSSVVVVVRQAGTSARCSNAARERTGSMARTVSASCCLDRCLFSPTDACFDSVTTMSVFNSSRLSIFSQ